MPPQKQPPWIIFASGLLLVALIVLFIGWQQSPQRVFDDAYITYRYAQNFRQGNGLVYNVGEQVLGTTTPLFALLLGVSGLVMADLETLGYGLGIFSWLLASWAAAGIFWQAKRPLTSIIAGIFVALQPSILASLGMETPLVVALMLASAWAWLSRRPMLAVVLLALLILTRQDGVLWAIVLGLEIWRRDQRLPWREALFTILLTLPWFLFAFWQYGSPLPNSVSAKMGQVILMGGDNHIHFVIRFWQTAVAGFSWPNTLAYLLSLLLGIWVIAKHERHFWWLPAWVLLYLSAYTWLGVENFHWYFTPVVVVSALVGASGIGYYPDRLYQAQLLGSTWGKRSPWQLGGLLMIVLVLSVGWVSRIQTYLSFNSPGYQIAYRAVGNWLNENTEQTDATAAIEIGVIGYLSERPILDTMGLVSPEMTPRQVGWTETLVYAVSQLWPEYAVVLENTAWDWVIMQWWFRDYYKPVISFDAATIYQREGRPVAAYQSQNNVVYPAGLTLNGADFSGQTLTPGGVLETWLHLTVQQNQSRDYQLTAYLIDAQTDARTAVTTVEPLYGGYKSSLWQAGDQLALPLRLSLPADLSPGVYQLGLFIYDPESGAGLPTTTTPPGSYPETKLGWLRVGSPSAQSSPGLVWRPMSTTWEEGIQLEALAAPTNPFTAGSVLPLGLQWHAAETPRRNLTVFVHLINEHGDILAQLDQRPVAGRWPTPAWQPAETIHDEIQIELPSNLPPGDYGLRIGLYDENGRLSLAHHNVDFIQLLDLVQIGVE